MGEGGGDEKARLGDNISCMQIICTTTEHIRPSELFACTIRLEHYATGHFDTGAF